ncbi:hypothetical protein A3E49_01545 [Candidatus Saccharibacteria bacterium RIFCSPHIGHO2_12_FULL_49_19]|nr:MAG: hypothetical protein A2708_02910 [Candidatus Saccharibacteria bacterium RIFCSPHIGHO2_01_FULL_49_21]OGL37111.1 MAG: hypothetical protein A3E49_01545 [Candidatus Saccharibacteria bacterium RIFCSPHIGHO2_12_FULL_49_19]OGL37309.1 MAG: hypothetical protein A3B63_02025 [Candidatus Saccharibacteria bacterium RIFCSPLOWO2_01_FULL_49_22]
MSIDLEKRVTAIEERNRRVEADKVWETSLVRRLAISLLTYLVVAGYLLAIDNDKPFVTAVVPAVGYFLSTLVLREIHQLWQNRKR